jgi:ATP-dependent Clp protease ATP-binding subunit ClpA
MALAKVLAACVALAMTSNAGARDIAANAIGFSSASDEAKSRGLKAIERTFSPEFRNRLDAIVTFDSLPMEVVLKIVDKFVRQIEVKLEEREVRLKLSDEARRHLAERGYDKKMGARPLGRLIQEEIENKLSDEILFGKLQKGGTAHIDIKDGNLVFEWGE